jgi:YidC/Oxa1 family membrane protein insertase
MEKRAVLAIVLSLIVVVVWMFVFAPQQPVGPPMAERETRGAPKDRFGEEQSMPQQIPVQKPKERLSASPVLQETLVTVDTGVTRLTLSSLGATVKVVQLTEYRTSLDDEAPPIEIRPVVTGENPPLTTKLSIGGQEIPLGNANFTPSATRLVLSPSQPLGKIVFHSDVGDGMLVERVYWFHYEDYVFEVDTQVSGATLSNGSAMTLYWGPGLRQQPGKADSRRGQTGTEPRSYINGKVIEEAPGKTGETTTTQGQVTWTALADTYFAAVLIPQKPVPGMVTIRQVQEKILEMGLRLPLDETDRVQTVRVYVGPKQQQLLEAAEPSLSKKLIDLGWLHPLAWPMVGLLQFVNGIVRNYGIAIIVVTLLIKALTWPLTQKSYKSMQSMQKLQPKIKELQVLYKDDRQAMNRAMMQLYRDQKVNPMGTCLPMLLQIPFFFAFYNALLYSIELRHAPFICWGDVTLVNLFGQSWPGGGVCDLSVYDPTFIMPILMGVGMLLQQRMTPTTGDPTQAKMMQFMPLIFLFFFIKAPAGLVLYWLTNTVLSVVQQLLVNRPRPAAAEAEASGSGKG